MKSSSKETESQQSGSSLQTSALVLGWIGFIITSGMLLTGKSPIKSENSKIIQAETDSKSCDISEKITKLQNQGINYLVVNNQTWMPVKGFPVEFIELTDKNKNYNVDREINGLKQNLTQALLVRRVDINSTEGQTLIKDFNITSIPQFITGKGFDQIKSPDGQRLVDVATEIFTKKGELYHLNSAKIGLSPRAFIEAPVFSDLEKEPRMTGTDAKITIVEFTDFQCPYCQKLHNETKSTIEKLVAEGKINYVLKDFPLSFHPNATFAHIAANIVQKQKGNQTYFQIVHTIFNDQKKWGAMPADQAKIYFIKLASELGANISDSDWTNSLYTQEMQNDQIEGQKYGVSGTPAMIIGKEFLSGAVPPQTIINSVNNAISDLK